MGEMVVRSIVGIADGVSDQTMQREHYSIPVNAVLDKLMKSSTVTNHYMLLSLKLFYVSCYCLVSFDNSVIFK